MQIVAVLLAAAGGFASGALWYGLFGGPWMRAVGLTKGEIGAERAILPFVVAGIASLATAGLMRHLMAASGVGGVLDGLITGAGIGVFFVAPWVLTHYAFAGRPRALWWIDAGHAVLAPAVIGTILGLFL